MSRAMTEEKASKWKKSAVRMLVGGIVGLGFASGMLAVAGSSLLDAMGPSRVALAAVGLTYALMGLFVAFGLAAPRAGAALLNVGDAEELREERGNMLRSVVTMAVFGAVLVLLALAQGPGFAGPVSAPVAMGFLLLALVAGIVATVRWRGQFDELNRQLGLEGCFWAFCLSWVVLTPWAAADFLGYGWTLTPIDVVTTLSAMMLIGSFAAIGKRGMMTR